MKCPGCGTFVNASMDGNGYMVEWVQIDGTTHDRARCRTTSGVARLIEALERIASQAEGASSSDAEYALVGIANAARSALEAP